MHRPRRLAEFRNRGVPRAACRRAGAAADGATPGDYSRGYDALAVKLGGAFLHDGSLSLIFSQIEERGGAIELMLPGGGVNAGSATPPAACQGRASSASSPSRAGTFIMVAGDFRSASPASSRWTATSDLVVLRRYRRGVGANRLAVPPPVLRVNDAESWWSMLWRRVQWIGVLLTSPGSVPATST
jgi:hypothetical protein